MKILVIGGNESLSQAAKAALVQAGIDVEVVDVNEVEAAISVEGGNIQAVIANVPMRAVIVDYDNAAEGDPIPEWNDLSKQLPYSIM